MRLLLKDISAAVAIAVCTFAIRLRGLGCDVVILPSITWLERDRLKFQEFGGDPCEVRT
jgi:hypothetical protein